MKKWEVFHIANPEQRIVQYGGPDHPAELLTSDLRIVEVGEELKTICIMAKCENAEELELNARLIASAPEMAEKLKATQEVQ